MRIKIGLLNRLEVDKLYYDQKRANQTSEFDILYEDTRQSIQDDPSDESNDPITDDTERGITDEVSTDETTDLSDDQDLEDPATDKTDESVIDDQAALESRIESCLSEHHVALSYLIESRQQFAMEGIGGMLKSGAALGLKYSPIAIKHLSKMLLFALKKTHSGLLKGTAALTSYLHQRLNSFQANRQRIKKALEVCELYEESTEPTDYTNDFIIERLKIGNSFDVLEHLKVLHQFMDTHYQHLNQDVPPLTSWLNRILLTAGANSDTAPKYLSISPTIFTNFIPYAKPDYQPKYQGMKCLRYKEILPGDLLLLAYVPDTDEKDPSVLLTAYKHTKLFFGFSQETGPVSVNAVMPSLLESKEILNYLDVICQLGLKHDPALKRLLASRRKLLNTFGQYRDRLLKQQNQVTVKESMIETVTPIMDFMDKVYLSGTVQVDDYISRVISASLKYVHDGIKSSPVGDSE